MYVLLSKEVSVLFRSESVDFASPEREFAASHLTVDLERDIIDHAARFTAYLVSVLYEILRTEGLNRK